MVSITANMSNGNLNFCRYASCTNSYALKTAIFTVSQSNYSSIVKAAHTSSALPTRLHAAAELLNGLDSPDATSVPISVSSLPALIFVLERYLPLLICNTTHLLPLVSVPLWKTLYYKSPLIKAFSTIAKFLQHRSQRKPYQIEIHIFKNTGSPHPPKFKAAKQNWPTTLIMRQLSSQRR